MNHLFNNNILIYQDSESAEIVLAIKISEK